MDHRVGSDPRVRGLQHVRRGRLFGLSSGPRDNLFGIHLPAALAYPMFPAVGAPGGIYNLPALLITLAVTWVLVRGVKEGAGANTAMVLVKIAAIAIFCLGAANAINVQNWKPFAPHGFPGV